MLPPPPLILVRRLSREEEKGEKWKIEIKIQIAEHGCARIPMFDERKQMRFWVWGECEDEV